MANKLNPMSIAFPAFGGAGNGTTGGIQLTSTGTSVNAALPTASDGNRARMVYVQANGFGYFRLTVGAGTAVVTDFAVNANNPIIMPVGGYTFANFISDSGTVKCSIFAIEGA